MEAIKKLLAGDRTHDDTPGTSTTTGTTTSHGHKSGLAGEGSHLATQHPAPGTTTTTAGPHDSNLLNKADPTVDSDRDGSKIAGTTTGTFAFTGGKATVRSHGSNLANKLDPRVDSDRDGSHTAGTIGASTFASGNTTAGPQNSNIANKADLRVDSDRDGPNATGSKSTVAPHSSSLLNKLDPRVDTGGDVSQSTGNITSIPGLIGTDIATGNPTSSGLTGSTTTTGPHDSNVANNSDPRVDSDRDGSRTTGNTGATNTDNATSSDHYYSRDAAGLGAVGALGAGAAHHRDNDRDNLGSSNPGLAGSDYRHNVPGSFPGETSDSSSQLTSHTGFAGSQPTSTFSTGLSAVQSTSTSNTGLNGLPPSSITGLTGSSTTAGPHDSNIANNLDPRIDSDCDGSKTVSITGASNAGTTSTNHHYGRDAAAVGGVGALGAGAAHHHGNDRSNVGTSEIGTTGSTTGPTSSNSTTGPHDSDLLNKLDPRVDSDRDGSKTTGTTGMTGTSTTPEHHYGRDAAAAEGVGAFGADTAHYRDNERENVANSTTVGPHDSNVANKLGPRVDSDRDGFKTIGTGTTGLTGAGTTGTYNSAGPHDSNVANKLDPRVNSDRDGPKTSGAGGFGHAGQHGHRTQDSGTGLTGTDRSGTLSETTTGHHYGRDAAVAAGGPGAFGATQHEHKKIEDPPSSSITQKGNLRGPAPNTAGPHKYDILNKLDPRVHSKGDKPDSTTTGSASVTESKDHHHGRDAAGLGAGVCALDTGAYAADKHRDSHERDTTTTAPHLSSLTDRTKTTTTAGPHSSDLANKADPRVDSDQSKDCHRPDAAIAGGAGGAAYEAERQHKHDKDLNQAERDAKREHKHEVKEEKRHHKEEVKHQKEEEKAHKAAEKEEKHHHKEEVAAHKAAEKVEEQHHKEEVAAHKAAEKAEKQHHKEEKQHHKEEVAAQKQAEKEEKQHYKEEVAAHKEAERAHHGRDAAAVGAFGVGAYGAEKHYQTGTTDTDRPLPVTLGNHGVGTGAGPGNALIGDDTTRRQHGNLGDITTSGHHDGRLGDNTGDDDSHLGHNAALAGGAGAGAGAGAVGLHEHCTHNHSIGTGTGSENTFTGPNITTDPGTMHNSHLDHDAALAGGSGAAASNPLYQQTSHHDQYQTSSHVLFDDKHRGQDLGDTLNGPDRNRGVAGSSGFPGTEGYGTGETGTGNTHTHGNTLVEKKGPVEVATGDDGRHRLHKEPKTGLLAKLGLGGHKSESGDDAHDAERENQGSTAGPGLTKTPGSAGHGNILQNY